VVEEWQTQPPRRAWEWLLCKGKAGDRNLEKNPDKEVSPSKQILTHFDYATSAKSCMFSDDINKWFID